LADYNLDTLLSTAVGATVTGGSTDANTRRLYDFTDDVASLDAVNTPFFAYLAKVRKDPTTDTEFKMLEDRSKNEFAGRTFVLDGAHDISGKSVGDLMTFTVETAAASETAVSWILKGMEFSIGLVDASNYDPQHVFVRVENDPTVGSTDTSFSGRIIADPTSSIASYSSNDTVECQIVGSAFAEATGSPDVWVRDLDVTYGYTQILKTAAEWSGSTLATEYKGYKNERERTWAIKLMEHASDIERMTLFGVRASQSGIRYSWGIIGSILANQGTLATGTTAITYTESKSYLRQCAYTSMSYDVFLGDLEIMFDPARGGSQNRLVLAGLPVCTFLNKLGNSAFLDNSVGYQYSPIRLDIDFNKSKGVFGHKILNIDTVNGNLHVVRNPMLRGIYKDKMVCVDLKNVSYRPLSANGYNRDTHILLDVANNDEDLRKDMILTEAGLAVTLFENQGLWSFH